MDDINTKVAKHEEKIKNLEKRMTKLEKVTEDVSSLAMSIQKLALVQEQMISELKDTKEDVKELKDRPARDAHEIKMKIISCIVTGIISAALGALLALILK